MPGLFARTSMARTSLEPSTHGVTPTVEHVHDPDSFNAFRGQDVHGVSNGGQFHDTPTDDNKTVVHYQIPKSEPDPIPVKVITQGGRELKAFRVITDQVNNVARRIVSKDAERSKLRLRNTGTVTIYVSGDASVASFTGWPILANEVLQLDVQTEVWGVSADGSSVNVAGIAEYALPEDAAHSIHPGT